MQKRAVIQGLIVPFLLGVCQGDFRSYNDCIRGTGDITSPNATDWTLYNGLTWHHTGFLKDYQTGLETSVTASFTWNASAGLNTSETSASSSGESQPRPGTPAYEVFGGIVDFSNRLIYYGNSGWWAAVEFTGLDPDKSYTFVTTTIRAADYTDRLTLFTLSGHLSAENNSSDGIYLKNGNQTVLQAGGNHRTTTGYVVRWDNIRVADRGDGTGSFSVRAEAYGSNYRAYPFGGFMLEENDNAAPVVDAGGDPMLSLPRQYLRLEGSVTDDGEGSPDGFLESTWSQIDGPASVAFLSDIHQPEVTVYFPQAGSYHLRLSATDGEKESFDEVQITVAEPVCPLGDMDGDCRVGLSDLAGLAGAWLDETGLSLFDLDGDTAVDAGELRLLSQSWLEDWSGSLQVTIVPPEAAAAGAQWSVNGGPWQPSGAVVSVTEGTHTVSFSKVSGWYEAQPQEVAVMQGQLTALPGQYIVPPQVLVIHEFLAVNSNVSDLLPTPAVNSFTEVNGQPAYEDWIEIHNRSEERVWLDGWYLTDDAEDLTRWRFPDGYSISAGGYLIVYASGKTEDKYGWPFVDDLGNLHTNFALASGGEYLALVRPNGTWVEHAYDEYPAQRGLVSYGLGSDGRTGYLTGVTRRAANTGIYEGLVGDTKFSVNRGFYDEPITVLITCSTPEAVIRYTTDTSEPTASSGAIYNPASPIVIDSTTCLRAAAFKPGYLPSNMDTQTYIFPDDVLTQATNPNTGAQVIPDGYPSTWPGGSHSGAVTGDYQMDPEIVHSAAYGPSIRDDLKAIPSFSIVAPVSRLFGSTGIYINESQDGTERFGSAELIDPNGTEVFQINCGIRMQGGAGEFSGGTTLNRWKSYKLSFRLNFRGAYDGKLEHPLFGPDAAQTYDTIVLDCRPQNSWVHPDSTQRLHGEYLRDQVSSDLQLAMGGYGCYGRPLHLYLNGMYWGLYWMHERPDDAFAASYMGGEEDDYDVIKHDVSNVIRGDNADYIAMFALSATSPDEITAFENLSQKLDVADFIDYLLANFYLGNGDWDHKNWYATRNRFDPDGRWRWHMWDGEHVMDDGTYTPEDVTTKNNSMAPTGLHHKWIGNPEYRMLFADRVHKHFFHDGAMMPDRFAALFTRLTDWIDRAIVGESARWGDNRRSTPYTRDAEWITECDRLLTSFIPTRRDVVMAQFTGKSPAWYPVVAAPEFLINGQTQYGGPAEIGAALSMSSSYSVWYTLDGSDPRLPGGGINTASASAYSGPITLTGSVNVRARTRTSGGVWSALAEAVFAVGPAVETLRITELMYHPVESDLEFIELKNIGAEPLHLNLVQFTKGIRHTFGDVSIAAGGYVLLVQDKPLFEAAYPDLPAGVPVVPWTDGKLDNAGETLTFVDALGREIQSFAYKDTWYPLTDGEGFSLTLADPLNPDPASWGQKAAWRASMTAGGSPGAEETGPAPGSIVINELLAHSHDILPDWIELHNTTAQSISIGGWFLSDNDNNLMKYEIPESTEIPAYGYVVFTEDQHFGAAFAFSADGETAYLTSGSGGQLTGYQAVQQFGASARAVSLGRHIRSDGDMDFVALSAPTPGAANAYPQVGPVVISELQYHPEAANTGDEYLELCNISGEAVVLQDWVETEISSGVFVEETVSWAFTEGIDFTFPADTEIPAGGFLILAKNPSAFSACYAGPLPPGTPVLGPFENGTALSNSGEKVRLCRPGDQAYGKSRPWIRVDQVNYDDQPPWPTEPDGDGKTLQRIGLSGYGNDPANWTAGDPQPGW